jgi:hypothetical protein
VLSFHSLPSVPQGDTRVFLYEVLPEAPFFLECNSFTSPDPHKVIITLTTEPPVPKLHCKVSVPPRGHVWKCRSQWGSGEPRSCAQQQIEQTVVIQEFGELALYSATTTN